MSDIEQDLQAAILEHQAGRLGEAERGYRAILAAQPDHADALHLLGLIAHQSGQNGTAVELIEKAIAVGNGSATYFGNLGGVHRVMGNLEKALEALNGALRLEPENPDVLYNMGLALVDAGDLEGAIEHYEKAQRLRPDHAATHAALGDAQRDLGRVREAVENYNKCLDIDPENFAANYNLGNALMVLGETEPAADAFRKAIQYQPEFAEAHNNLGIILHMLGEFHEAMACYRKAIELDPAYAPAHDNLGVTLQEIGHMSEAVESHRAAIRLQPDTAVSHNNLGNALRQQGKVSDAVTSYTRALEIEPDYAEAKSSLRSARSRQVPNWHAPMLADLPRNDAYQRAIEKAVTKSSRVLDIGTGSGLLALMAARAGAKSVVTCEMSKVLAEIAQEIVVKNGFSDQIKVINKKSTDLRIGDELSERANILVSEILGSGVINEGVLPTHRHAIKDLLTPDAVIIPASITVLGALVEVPRLRNVYPMQTISGFDLSPFDSLRDPAQFLVVNLEYEAHETLSDVIELANFDLKDPPAASTLAQPNWHDLEVTASADGSVHGIAFWFDLHLDDEITVSSGPGGTMKHWLQAVNFFEGDTPVTKGDRVSLRVYHTDSQFGFGIRRLD